jgi:hypothetical protein
VAACSSVGPLEAGTTPQIDPSTTDSRVIAVLRHAGQEVKRIDADPVKLELPKTYGRSMTYYALITQAITIVIVGIGLLAAAQEKLQTLDWMAGLAAILVIGFSAEALKRVLTKPN